MRLFFKCQEADAFIFVLFPDPVTLSCTHGNLSSNQTNAIFVNKGGIAQWIKLSLWIFLRWQYGLRQMKWCMPDCETSSSFSLSRNHLLMRFRMFKSGVFEGAHVSMETLSAVTKLIWITTRIFLQIKGVHLNFSRSFGWYESAPLPVNLLLSDRQCLYSLQPFCCGVVCVWLMWISV